MCPSLAAVHVNYDSLNEYGGFVRVGERISFCVEVLRGSKGASWVRWRDSVCLQVLKAPK